MLGGAVPTMEQPFEPRLEGQRWSEVVWCLMHIRDILLFDTGWVGTSLGMQL